MLIFGGIDADTLGGIGAGGAGALGAVGMGGLGGNLGVSTIFLCVLFR